MKTTTLSYHQATHFQEVDLNYWRKLYRSCWSLNYWNTKIQDIQHYNIWHAIDSRYRNNQCVQCQSSRDYKMLYDSYLWKTILHQHGYHNQVQHIIELLPGMSATIPVALCSLGFKGRLDRIDMDSEVALPYKELGYTVKWIRQNISSNTKFKMPYDLIVGNHIIDDLIFCFLIGKRDHDDYSMSLDDDYRNPDKCAAIWQKCTEDHEISCIIEAIVNTFISILDCLSTGATLVLREYPAAFAMDNADLIHIGVHLSVFCALSERLSMARNVSLQFPDLNTINVPLGCRYPNSILTIVKL